MNAMNFMMDWDRTTDVLEILSEGTADENIINVDSLKFPGVVKRIHRLTGDCIGFTIHDFSLRFPADAKKSESVIMELLIESMRRTTQADSAAFRPRFEANASNLPLPMAA